MNPAERISELTEKLNYYNQRYYMDSVSEISDQEFDMLLKELESLENQYPDLKLPESPTHRVGGTITKNFASVEHRYPMLSLANTYNEQELIDFDERVRKGLNGETYEYICELKFDGISLSMTYENGVFVRGVTRGDGVRGDDITNNVKTIKTLPLKIKTPLAGATGAFEIRGEGFLPYSSFEKMNADAEAAGEESYANARNAASGSFKLQDSAEVARRGLDAYVYQFLSDEEVFATHEESLIALKNLGFNVSQTWTKCSTIQEVIAYINEWDEKRFSLPLATDGIVIKLNSIAQRAELGYTAKSPRWAIAYKYKAESKPAILKAVTYQVGRTGAITPVAELDNEKLNGKGIHLSGTTVKRASLHNANEIERLGLRIGDTVFVEKGGEIIPKVTAVDLSKRDMFNTQEIVYPSACPECGSALTRKEGEANHYCTNEKGCPPQIRGRIEHFIHRKAMNIDSLGEGKIELLYDKGLVNDITDLYDLTYEKLFGLEKVTEDELTGKVRKIGFKEKTVQNILDGIEKSKQAPFKQVLFGIGIRYVGATVAEKLASFFKNIDNIKNADYETLRTAPEIGDKIAQSIVEFFQNEDNLALIERLRAAGLQMAALDEVKEIEGDQLAGKTFLYTGTFANFEREALEQKIEANGGKVVSGVSGKLDFLIVGEKPGSSKIEKAKKLNVTMISEEEFMAMLG
ncbi:DNA ligase [Emticicia aquatilis]|uniref:DNA ligase n=1 Tax=Emticicia aquatilis TaxID=1537369 RepID=A0A916YDL5_9BACT|nr:NAD-dependent DNA ligase LigA [Emticicia aquatilis]GGD41253.1 DNA ligase [Emticicia aquatilis]